MNKGFHVPLGNMRTHLETQVGPLLAMEAMRIDSQGGVMV